MKMKMKNRSRIHDINLGNTKSRPRPRHGHEHSKYKKFLSMMMLICIKQHLSNIWSSIHRKVKQNWGWVEKSVYALGLKVLQKSCEISSSLLIFQKGLPTFSSNYQNSYEIILCSV